MNSPTDPVSPHRAEADEREPATGSDVLPAQQPIATPNRSSRRDGMIAITCALAYLGLFLIANMKDRAQHYIVPFSQGAILATTLISLPLILLFTVSVARALVTKDALIVNTVASGLLFVPTVLILVLHARFPSWPLWVTIHPAFHAYHSIITSIPDHGLILIWFATCTGVWLSRLVREMKILLPIAVVLAVMDLLTVFGGGVVQQAVQGRSQVAQA